ncbi:hypothetical protein HAP48_0004235 [Bradyrhizobium septentrionale]|uniref:hypothetical protein n=1 Tax=Bradyrhizobium septentrionale TaxID=1404411 RepID=UPI001CCB2D52|nr:hypothetical protein [Bradyrhizobium septentrionale]UGY16762.1 hypothetical protein HAP48_0004235 [Bradyrhizobium septentrionale]
MAEHRHVARHVVIGEHVLGDIPRDVDHGAELLGKCPGRNTGDAAGLGERLDHGVGDLAGPVGDELSAARLSDIVSDADGDAGLLARPLGMTIAVLIDLAARDFRLDNKVECGLRNAVQIEHGFSGFKIGWEPETRRPPEGGPAGSWFVVKAVRPGW